MKRKNHRDYAALRRQGARQDVHLLAVVERQVQHAHTAAVRVPTTFSIAQATPTLTVSDAGGTFNGHGPDRWSGCRGGRRALGQPGRSHAHRGLSASGLLGGCADGFGEQPADLSRHLSGHRFLRRQHRLRQHQRQHDFQHRPGNKKMFQERMALPSQLAWQQAQGVPWTRECVLPGLFAAPFSP